jgi:hypothetical protein
MQQEMNQLTKLFEYFLPLVLAGLFLIKAQKHQQLY